MSSAVVQICGIEEACPGKRVVRSVLAGTFGRDDLGALSGWADGLYSAVKEAGAGKDHSVGILVDISGLETYTDPSVITLLSDLMKKDVKFVRRTATFGGTEAQEMALQVIQVMAQRDNLKNFKTEAEAVKWLKE